MAASGMMAQGDDIHELLGGIRSEVAALSTEILSELKSSISAVKTSLQVQKEKLKDIEESLTDVDGRVASLETMCATLSKDNERMRAKLDDLENHSRRNNVRIIGIPEQSEGTHPTTFMEELLLEVFGKESFAKPPVVDRAHRSLAPPPRPHQAPRPFIVQLHHYQTRELILRLTREKGQLLYKGSRIHFYPDVSVEVAKRRAAFNPIKAQLREAGIEFGLLFPARLRITHNGVRHFFDSPQQATEYIQGALSLAVDK
ncbi:putative transposase element L1Md-A101/L1Md-A102/L1Md-A2 [Labeo rohita]|uniref:Putative transposase element L1Md-A101/L1Md-A102/L1Md-A2 n=1 Tax=Labeo rohita TaxID=84645 RepID=A0A498MNT5_LABRO|nr:putative transposase element L1Md-A101/L1Md-A102/L1Md-A2 [Labeo rohita]